MTHVRDLEHRFPIAGLDYALQVCGCGEHPAPVTAGRADVVLVQCVTDELLNHEDDEPEKVVRQVIDHAMKFMPSAITREQCEEFADAAHAWVCEHRAAAALRDHSE